MRSAIFHQGIRTLLYLGGFSGFIFLCLRGAFDRMPSNRDHFRVWLRNSPGSRRLFAVVGVAVLLTTVRWLSAEIPAQTYALPNRSGIQTLFELCQNALNAVGLFWPFVVLLFIRSHAAKLNYKERESRNVRSVVPLTDKPNVPNVQLASSKSYWERRALWMGAGWLAISAVGLLSSTLFTFLSKFLQHSGRMPRASSSVQYLIYTVGLALLPLLLLALFLLHPRFRSLRALLKTQVVPLCWLLTGLLIILEVWNCISEFAEMPPQYWASQSYAFWHFIFSGTQGLWTLALAILLTFAISRRVRCFA
ncbi:MAG: hypothetical protein JWM04_619 [Verrucomicrobiales bacterium]|nr:hypothetical protein [Verrucomicrobiales bacterium]